MLPENQELYDGSVLIQNGLDELNSKSAVLSDSSSQIQKALIEIKRELDNTNTNTSQITTLVNGSSQIKSGIDLIDAGITELQKNVNFAAYKSVMEQNGLDIDELQSRNAQTISALSSQISSMNIQVEALNSQITDLTSAGAGENQTAPLRESVAQLNATILQLNEIMLLVQGNDAAITGTNSYLTQINQNIPVVSPRL